MKRKGLIAGGICLAAILLGWAVYVNVTNDGIPADAKLEGWQLVWHDEFDGENGSKPDPTKWGYDIGNNNGWGNRELQYYTDSEKNAYVQDGKLVIKAIQEDMRGWKYTSARLVTKEKGDWTYGRIAVKARLPHGEGLQGIWPAIWMLPTDWKYGGWPKSGEIDIMEMIGKQPRTIVGTIHFGEPHKHVGANIQIEDDGFHEYAVEWEPGEIRWYLDGKHWQTRKSHEWFTSAKDAEKPAPFDQRFHLLMNVAVGGNWPGYPDSASVFPQTMEVEYVRVYEKLKN